MAKNNITQYDATAANNTDIDSINIAEGMAASDVNNAIRSLMSHLKNMDSGSQALTSPSFTAMSTDTINEKTSTNGVAIDSVTLKDGELGTTASPVPINSSSLNGGQFGGRRNLIVNSGMQVSQRGTSATTMTNAYATVDRFRGFSNGGGAFTGEQYSMTASDIASTGQRKALKVLVSTADSSIASADYYAIQHKLEGDDLQHLKYGTSSAETMTISFFVKSDTTGTYFFTVDKIANGQTAYRLPQEFTISSADTWEKKTLTISPTAGSTSLITSSAGVIGGGTGHGMSLYWGFAWGTDYHGTNNTWGTGTFATNASANGFMSTIGNEFFLTGVQLELGSVATPFEHRSFGEEQTLCQRYFYRFGMNNFNNASPATSAFLSQHIQYPVTMRSTPTLSRSSNGTFSSNLAFSAFSGATDDMCQILFQASSASTNCFVVGLVGDCDAEL